MYLSVKGIEQCVANTTAGSGSNIKATIQRALDLKNIGAAIIPDGVSRYRKEPKLADCVLQVSSVTNVSAPKSNPESNSSPRLLRFELTDGHSTVSALALRTINVLGLKTLPGTKLRLKLGKMLFQHGFFILSEQHLDVLGGNVETLVEKWKLEQAHANYLCGTRKTGNEAGPPKWVPFGQKVITGSVAEVTGKFKSLDPTGNKERELKEDGSFEQQRKATIAKATKAGPKIFGGKKEIIDRGDGVSSSRGWYERPRSIGGPSSASNEIGRNERSSKFGRKGRVRGDRDRDGDELLVSNAPSRPSTLFDFLESKIPNASISKAASNSGNTCQSGGVAVGRWEQSFDTEGSRLRQPRERSSRNDSDPSNRQFRRPPSAQQSKSRNAHESFPSDSHRADGNLYRPKSSATGDANSFASGRAMYDRRGEYDSPRSQASSSYQGITRKLADSRSNGYADVKNFVATTTSSSDRESLCSNRPLAFKPGDACVAKYWEDNKFYSAIVHAVAPSGSTCVVLFPQYGNYEEVLAQDVLPANDIQFESGERKGVNNHVRSTTGRDQGFRRHNTKSMGMSNQTDNKQGFGRPLRQVYLPPAQRS